MKKKTKVVSLDILRGLACLLVYISHIRVATQYFKNPRYDYIQSFAAWGKESVVIFFILSGIVINLSSRNHVSRTAYFKKRIIRILPIYLVVLLICFSANSLIFHQPIDIRTFWGNFFFSGTLEAYICPVMPLNPAVWSITCEVFFYIVFGLIYQPNRLRGIWVWFFVCCFSIVYKVYDYQYHTGFFYYLIFLLNNSFLWLLGYLLLEYCNRLQTSLPSAICGVLMIPMLTRLHNLPHRMVELSYIPEGIYLIPFFIYLLRNLPSYHPGPRLQVGHYLFLLVYPLNIWLLWHYSNSLPANKIFYIFFPLISLLLYWKHAADLLWYLWRQTGKLFRWLALISYPFYLLHMPIMYIAFYYLPNEKYLGMFLSLGLTTLLSYILEVFLFEKLSMEYGRRWPKKELVK